MRETEKESERERQRENSREREREREEPFFGSVSRDHLRFGSGAVWFCAVRFLRFRFCGSGSVPRPCPEDLKRRDYGTTVQHEE